MWVSSQEEELDILVADVFCVLWNALSELGVRTGFLWDYVQYNI